MQRHREGQRRGENGVVTTTGCVKVLTISCPGRIGIVTRMPTAETAGSCGGVFSARRAAFFPSKITQPLFLRSASRSSRDSRQLVVQWLRRCASLPLAASPIG